MTNDHTTHSHHDHDDEHDHAHGPEDHGHDHADHGHDDHEGHDHDGHEHGPESDPDTEYNWRIHHPFGDDGDEVAVEVSPKSGLLPRWRFVTPGSYTDVVRWGVGAPGGGPIDTDVRNPVEGGPVQLVNGPEVRWMGSVEALSSSKSAYLVFKGEPPHYVAFGQAEEPDGPPGALEGLSFGDHSEHPPEDARFG